MYNIPPDEWSCDQIIEIFGLRGFAPASLLDVDDPNPVRAEEHRQRAKACALELDRDGFLKGILGQKLLLDPSRVVILAGPSRSGKKAARLALEKGLKKWRESQKRTYRETIDPTGFSRLVTVPWLTTRPPRSDEYRDSNLDRIQVSPQTLKRLIEEDWDRTDKRIAAAIHSAYHPYLLLAQSPVGLGIPPKYSLEYALRNNAHVSIECSPDMGVALKRILNEAHLMLIMSRDLKAAGHPRPTDTSEQTIWKQAQSDLCWQLLRFLLTRGKAHWLFDSLCLPPAFRPGEFGNASFEEQLNEHTAYIGNEVATNCVEVYKMLGASDDFIDHTNIRSPFVRDDYPRVREAFRLYTATFLGERKNQIQIEDPSLEILEAFRELKKWGLICPGRRLPEHWIK